MDSTPVSEPKFHETSHIYQPEIFRTHTSAASMDWPEQGGEYRQEGAFRIHLWLRKSN